jgi:hypothetical protein
MRHMAQGIEAQTNAGPDNSILGRPKPAPVARAGIRSRLRDESPDDDAAFYANLGVPKPNGGAV